MIHTDHASLKWLPSFKDLEDQLARWMERLQRFQFQIVYRKGQPHKDADGLLRHLCESFECKYCAEVEQREIQQPIETVVRIVFSSWDLMEWQRGQKEDLSLATIYQAILEGKRPLHFRDKYKKYFCPDFGCIGML